MSSMYIIAGPNGAGKTTAAMTVLPEMLDCYQFVNADEIAKGLSPLAPESVSIQGGRLMLQRIDDLMKQGADFAFETTLATKSYVHLVHRAHQEGYFVTLLYFWLSSPALAKERVIKRVSEGGHNIPPDVIERRYHAGLTNLSLFLSAVDRWYIYNNEFIPAGLCKKGQNKTIDKYQFMDDLIEEGLRKTAQKLVEKEKKIDGYLVTTDKDGKVKKVPARDL